MSKRNEVDHGFTERVLMGMGLELAEALATVQRVVVQYNALANAHGLQPACPNPPTE